MEINNLVCPLCHQESNFNIKEIGFLDGENMIMWAECANCHEELDLNFEIEIKKITAQKHQAGNVEGEIVN